MKMTVTMFILLLPTFLNADGLTFGTPSFSGPGCPSTGVSWALSPNNNSLSILFSQFSLTGRNRTYCQVAVPVSTQNQTAVEADYRGFHDLPSQATYDQRVSYTLDSRRPISHINSVNGPNTTTFTDSHQVKISCNGPRILKILVDAITQNASSYSLDSIDLAQATSPQAAVEICNSAAATFSPWILAMVALFAL